MHDLATRRSMIGGLAALPLVGCASAAVRERDVVQVNLTRALPPGAMTAAEGDAAVRTSFDAVSRMTLAVMVNGSGPYRFVVDTGANRSVLSTEVATALDLEPSGRAMVHGIAGVLPSPTVRVQSLGIGGLVSRRVSMPVLDRRFLGADGLLGVDVMANRRAILDFRGQTFTLAAGDDPRNFAAVPQIGRDATDAIVVQARHRFGQLTIVDAEIGGVKLTAFLDSGAENTVGNPALRDALLGRGALNERFAQVELVSATGQLAAGEVATVPPLRLGGVRLGNMACVFADLHTFRIWDLDDRPALLIGVDVMRHFDSIELNFRERLVKFRSSQFGRTINTAG
ncbi:MAG: retroviral-like aspartic protease family protein [Caulobacter sp.]|nr:retroviral-like aspartic protease family protein [Caulobacter sp.]